jgi:hypothetical protein
VWGRILRIGGATVNLCVAGWGLPCSAKSDPDGEESMSEQPKSWVEEMCRHLADIERETVDKLGEEKAGFFAKVAGDCMDINAAIHGPNAEHYNFVLHTSYGIFKEVYWFHFFFLAGNYPLLLSRLRYVWESMFRAYFAENYPLDCKAAWAPPGPSIDDKVAWLQEHERQLNWDRCLEPVLRNVLPLADREREVRQHYKAHWQSLHKYVHPSAYLAGRMVEDSALHAADSFDEQWAVETLDIGSVVFDLVWLAVLNHHPEAFDRLDRLFDSYPVVSSVFKKGKGC